MPTPEEYDKSRNEIRQQIREKLGMKVPDSGINLPPLLTESEEQEKQVGEQILEELKAIKEILRRLLEN